MEADQCKFMALQFALVPAAAQPATTSVAIVDTNSREISSIMQRMRRQENTKSGQ
jgi:hypothetical protein